MQPEPQRGGVFFAMFGPSLAPMTGSVKRPSGVRHVKSGTRLQWISVQEVFWEALKEFAAAVGIDPHNGGLNPADWVFYRVPDEKARAWALKMYSVRPPLAPRTTGPGALQSAVQ